MFLNKKAVSPLIATVLLVMIVVSIGAAVMVVIQGLSEEQINNIDAQTELLQCGTDVAVNLIKIGSTNRMCINVSSAVPYSGSFALLMENTGLKDISGFRVTLIGDDGFNTSTYDSTTLDKGEIQGFRFVFGGIASDATKIQKITINPRVPGREIVTCNDPTLVFDVDFISLLQNCSASTVTWDDTYGPQTT
jgi:flagellin-like protein